MVALVTSVLALTCWHLPQCIFDSFPPNIYSWGHHHLECFQKALANALEIVAALMDIESITWHGCTTCAWTNQMRGFVRPMEHVMFYESIKPKNYLTLHELQRVDEMPAEFQQFLQKFPPEAAQKPRLRTVPQAAAAPAVVLATTKRVLHRSQHPVETQESNVRTSLKSSSMARPSSNSTTTARIHPTGFGTQRVPATCCSTICGGHHKRVPVESKKMIALSCIVKLSSMACPRATLSGYRKQLEPTRKHRPSSSLRSKRWKTTPFCARSQWVRADVNDLNSQQPATGLRQI